MGLAVHATWGLALGTLGCCCCCSVAVGLPPNDPEPDQWSSRWHLPAGTHLSAGDVNALFFWRGVWHLMSQWEMEVPNTYPGKTPATLPVVGWAHRVSTDLLRWAHIEPALVPGPPSTTMEGCYDGSVSMVYRDGRLVPMLMADGACGELPDPEANPKTRPPGKGCVESFGNTSGGTLAFAADLDDANLTKWVKDGPLVFDECGPRGGPSAVWQVAGDPGGGSGRWNMLMLGNESHEWRYETTDPEFKRWTLADANFLPAEAGSVRWPYLAAAARSSYIMTMQRVILLIWRQGNQWHPLPRSVEGCEEARRPHTHVYQAGYGRHSDGLPRYVSYQSASSALSCARPDQLVALLWAAFVCQLQVMGTYDEATQTFSNATVARLLDIGAGVMFGSFGDDPTGNRTLHISQMNDVPAVKRPEPLSPYPDPPKKPGGRIHCNNRLTSIREVRYDPRIDMLVEQPIAELAQLRARTVADDSLTLATGAAPVTLGAGEQDGKALDYVLNLTLPTEEAELVICAKCAEAAATAADLSPSSSSDAPRQNATDRCRCKGGVAFALRVSQHNASLTMEVDGLANLPYSGGGKVAVSGFPLLPDERSLEV